MELAMSALVYLCLLGALATLTRLAVSGLYLRYLWFTVWVGSNIIKSAAIAYASSQYGNRSHEYIIVWQVSHAITALLLILAGIETYSHIANDYPTIGNYGR